MQRLRELRKRLNKYDKRYVRTLDALQAVVTTMIRLRLDSRSTVVRRGIAVERQSKRAEWESNDVNSNSNRICNQHSKCRAAIYRVAQLK